MLLPRDVWHPEELCGCTWFVYLADEACSQGFAGGSSWLSPDCHSYYIPEALSVSLSPARELGLKWKPHYRKKEVILCVGVQVSACLVCLEEKARPCAHSLRYIVIFFCTFLLSQSFSTHGKDGSQNYPAINRASSSLPLSAHTINTY